MEPQDLEGQINIGQVLFAVIESMGGTVVVPVESVLREPEGMRLVLNYNDDNTFTVHVEKVEDEQNDK